MSAEEIQEQHDRISTIAVTVDETSLLIKKLIKLWPAISIAGVFIGGLIGFVWGVFVFNASLIKKPEYTEHLKTENANVSTLVRYHVIDSTVNDNQDKRLDNLETSPKLRLTEITQAKDKYGKRHYNPIN